MAKQASNLLSLLSILILIVFSSAQYMLEESVILDKTDKPFSGAKSFKLNLKSLEDSPYTHIEIKASQSKPIVFLSDTVQCQDNRLLMGVKHYEKSIDLYVKREQFPENNILYICVKCEIEENCNYNISQIPSKSSILNMGKKYSYYISEKNTEMEFSIKAEDSKPVYYQIWVKGANSSLQTNYANITNISFEGGIIYQFKNNPRDEGENYCKLKVIGKKGQYATIGTMAIFENKSKNKLVVNDLEYMGIISNEVSDICFQLYNENANTNENEIIYINEHFYEMMGYTYFKNSNNEKGPEKDVYDNFFFTAFLNKDFDYNTQLCVGVGDPSKQKLPYVFSLKLGSNKRSNYNKLMEDPQIPGLAYHHVLFKDEIAIFRGTTNEKSNIINYSMKQILGFSDMYVVECSNYPECNFNGEKLKNMKNVYSSSRISVYNYNLKDKEQKPKITALSSFQPVMIVKCNEGQYKNNNIEYCVFETNIFTNKDRILLKEAETFSNFILKGQNNYYHINFNEPVNTFMNLDIMVFSGEVSANIEDKGIPGNTSFLSNKISYEFNITDKIKSFNFNIHAEENSFYIVKYQLKRGDMYLNILESRVNFVESLTTEAHDYRMITLRNHKKDIGRHFLSSFYSKNCRYKISRYDIDKTNFTIIDTYDDFAHLLLENNSTKFIEGYMFLLKAIDTEISTYQKKSCLLYISGFELEDEAQTRQRAISLSEGISHYFSFSDDYPKISYTFYISDKTNPLYIDFNLVDKAGFNVKIIFGHKTIDSFKIYRNQQRFINSSVLQNECLDKQVCIVQVDISLEAKLNKTKVVETTISHVKAAPMYLERNVVKQDIIIGSYYKHYYLSIDKGEVGEITVDYKRSSGHIYASVVPKNIESNKTYNDSEWRGIYKFPKSRNESIEYETYFKKININTKDTQKCDKGCYLLITIQSSNLRNKTENQNETYQLVPYRITINPRIYPYEVLNYNYIPKVRIPVNEFIIGNIAPSDKEIYEFYQVWLPFDSDLVIVDWQADQPSLYINVGNIRPTTENYDFIIKRGHDTIIRIKKETILEVLEKKNMTLPEKNSIKRLSLVFGIHTSLIDTLYSSVYAFKLFQPPNYVEGNYTVTFELLHIRSDQKVQCVPKESGGVLGCAFAVIFDGNDIDSHLIVYPRAQDDTVGVQFIGDLVEAEAIERNNISKVLNQYMPGMQGEFMSSGDVNYIYIDKIDKSKCLLLVVTLDKGSIIEVLSSTYKYDYKITPNPSTPQIFALKGNSMHYSFDTTQDLLINIACVSGQGYFYWDEEKPIKYYLSGKEDRLTLTSATKDVKNKLANLVAKPNNKKKTNNNMPDFIYYITYYPRNPEYNIDQVQIGRSTEFNYRDTKFPLNFYTQINYNDISVSFNFYKYFLNNSVTMIESDKPMFEIWGVVITEEEAYSARYDKSYKPDNDKAIKGHFDGAFGVLYISSEDIIKYNYNEKEKLYLFFSVEKSDNNKYDFHRASVEIFISQDDPFSPRRFCPENVYINGKLGKRQLISYKLKTNIDNPVLNIEISINNPSISFSLHTKEYDIFNSTIRNYTINEYIKGKRIMSFPFTQDFVLNNTVYLTMYNIEEEFDEHLSNFIFKYANEKSLYDLNITSNYLKSDTVELKKDNNSYTITFNKINHTDVVYYVKGIYENSFNDEELMDSMAISETNGIYRQFNNSLANSEGKIQVKLNKANNVTYIKVLAKITNDAKKLYLLYNPVLSEPEPITRVYKPTIEIIGIKYNSLKKIVRRKFESSSKAKYIQRYKLYFNSEIPYYLKVETISEKLPNQVIYFSKEDSVGATNRLQLAQGGPSLSNVMWIKTEYLGKFESLNIPIQCQNINEDTCNYKIIISGHNLIEIDNTTFSYNYYVSHSNQIMEFEIKNNYFNHTNVSDLILTFYATGAQKIFLEIYRMNTTQYNFNSGSAISINMTKNYSYILIVQGNVGDYISIGSKVTLKKPEKSGKSVSPLKKNDKQITGILNKDILNKECYLLEFGQNQNDNDIYYITGIFYNKIGEIVYADEKMSSLDNTIETIRNGYYYHIFNKEDKKPKYLCVQFPTKEQYPINDLPYSLQMTGPNENINEFNINPPQISGISYQRITNKKSVSFYNVILSNLDSKYLIYNMMSLEGLPQMYIYKCTTFPLCYFNYDELISNENITKVNQVNNMAIWIGEKKKKLSPIQSEQDIMFVKCPDSNNNNSCRFQTSIFGNDDLITLNEKQPLSQMTLKGEKEVFFIDLQREKDIYQIFIDLLIITGDVSLSLKSGEGKKIDYSKNYLGNKIFYSLYYKDHIGKYMTIIINARINSYYVIEYKIINKNDVNAKTINDIYSGINYLIPISKTKNINIHNFKLLSNSYYLTNFHSLNCKFKIERLEDGKTKKIISYGNYAQQFIKDQNDIKKTVHSYKVTLEEGGSFKDKEYMCMLYVSALEITKENSSIQKELLIEDGVPQRIIFEKDLHKISYIYIFSELEKSISISVNTINIAKYTLNIIFNNNNSTNFNFSSSEIFFINSSLIKNNSNNKGISSMKIELSAEQINNNTPIIETTIRQIKNVPVYIPKGITKKDFISGGTLLFLYTDIEADESGYISINLDRGSLKIYGRIVDKRQAKDDANSDWRKYKFPRNKDEGDLKYDFYNKKLLFTNKDTSKCVDGCYILITINSSMINQQESENIFYPFTISIRVNPNSNGILHNIGKIIEILPDEYIIGFLDNDEKIQKKDMYEYYEISIPYDADIVEFDWQSDAGILLVNVGNERPIYKKDKAHFIFDNSRSDTIFQIKRDEIKKKGNLTSIDKVNLVIGVYTEYKDTVNGTAYSFKVHFSKSLTIHKVSSDHKTLCKPDKIGNEYRCLYMIKYDSINITRNLMIYPRSKNKSATTYMYGEFLEKEIYDSFDIDKLKNKIPKENATYSTKRDNNDYISLNINDKNKKSYFYVKVTSDRDSVIELITSLTSFDVEEISPNPSSIQLFQLKKNQKLKLNFLTRKRLLINIASIFGEAKLYFRDDPKTIYDLSGRDDILSLALDSSKGRGSDPQLIIEIKNNTNSSQLRNLKEENNNKTNQYQPVFAFFIEYFLRPAQLNFDEISLGRTTEVAYNNTDFPVYYYCKIDKLNNDVMVFFNLRDLKNENNDKSETKIRDNQFVLKGGLMTQNTVYSFSSKLKPNFMGPLVLGKYDPAIKTGQILLPLEKLKEFKINETDKPTLYLEFSKDSSNKNKYKNLRLELSIIQENEDIPVSEKLYQYGKIYKNNVNSYRLKVDRNKTDGYMRIQFAANSHFIDFSISENKDKKNMTIEKETKTERGKVFITFKNPNKDFIYLNVFSKGIKDIDDLSNYAFKYMNSKNKNFFEYPTLNNKTTLNISKTPNKDKKTINLSVKFNRIEKKNINVVYSLKVIKKWEYSKEANNQTIALSEADALVAQKENPSGDEIILEMDDVPDDYSNLVVIAQIKDGPIVEYVSYVPEHKYIKLDSYDIEKIKKDGKDEKEGSKKLLVYIIIGGGAFALVVIILLIIILVVHCKNKDLMKQVNAVSFAGSGVMEREKEEILI